MKIRPMLYFILILWATSSIGQQPVLEKNVREQLKRNDDNWGPNTQHFLSGQLGYGIILPINTNDSMAIRDNQSSNHWHLGWRYKLKLNNTFALGMDVQYQRQQFRIKQNKTLSIFSEGVEYDKQRLIFNAAGLGTYLRLNFGKRGNRLGHYLDVAGEMNYVFASRLKSQKKVDATQNNGSEKVTLIQSDLNYTRSIQSFAVIRSGWDKIAIFAKYRFSDIFIRSNDFYQNQPIPELPIITVGIEFSNWYVPYNTQR